MGPPPEGYKTTDVGEISPRNSKETTITSDDESQEIVTASIDTKSAGDTERQDGAYAGKKQASGCIERRDTD